MYSLRIVILLTACIQILHAQELKIIVKNQNNQRIGQANISVNQKNVGYADDNGILIKDLSSFQAPYRIQASYIGYVAATGLIEKANLQDSLVLVLNDRNNLDEVIVTAGRKAEHISTVPSSISILNEEEIQAQSQINNNLSTILGATIPGLGPATNKATNSGQTLRGRAVLVLIDGIPQSTPLMNGSRDIRTIDPNVIERVEVIKGATSIYGNGSAGGIINYITRKSPENGKAINGISSVRSGINPFHAGETAGYKFSQLLYGRKQRFSYTLSASIDYTGLQRDADGLALGQTDGLSNSYQNNGFIKLGYDFDSTSSITAWYNYYNSTQHAKYISQTGKYDQSPTIGIKGEDPGEPTGTPYNHNAMINYSKTGIWGNHSLQATLYYNTFRSMNRYVANGSAWYGPGQTQINSEKKGLRLNLNSPFQLFRSAAELTYGLDVLNDVTDQNLTDGRVYIPFMDMLNVAPYAQLRIDFFENLILKAGARYENATVTINDFNTIATGPNNEGSTAVKGGKIPYKGATFNAGLRYNRYTFFNPFISFSQGFAINELGRIVRRATDNDLDSIKTDPVITNNYEIGFSSHYRIFNLTASYYYSSSKMGVELVDVGGYLMAQRLPEVVQGFELAIDAKIHPMWTLGGTYAFVEGKSEQEDGSKTYLNGSRIAPPKATAYLYFTPNPKLNLQLHWLYTGSRDRFDANDQGIFKNSEGSVESISLFNLSGSYRFNARWSVGLGVENLFNKDYYPVVSQYRALDAEYVKGTGTNASLTVAYKF
jgi:Outer membrane receptor proteins, mostly Fe transport